MKTIIFQADETQSIGIENLLKDMNINFHEIAPDYEAWNEISPFVKEKIFRGLEASEKGNVQSARIVLEKMMN